MINKKLREFDYDIETFIINGVIQSNDNGNKIIGKKDGKISIEFKINGIEVDFEKLLLNVFKRMNESIDFKIKKSMKDRLLELPNLSKLQDKIEELSEFFKNKINDELGLKDED